MNAPAQTPTPPYGAPISLDQARAVMAAAEAEAQRNGWPMVISVVDSGGHVVMLHRLDNTQLGSVTVATGKATTAVQFRRASKVFEDAVMQGGLGLRILGTPGIVPLDGGLPLFSGGKVIGAIGVSGGLSTQDAQVARAGAEAVK
ncbi:MAG: heme-binding protein [Pseudomonadota bacterium]